MIVVNAAGLGIDLSERGGMGLYRWLLASLLIGKRIRASVAVQAYRVLVEQQGAKTVEIFMREATDCLNNGAARLFQR